MKLNIKKYALAIAWLGFSASSCVDLDPVDYSEINPSNFPQSEADIQSLVTSVYYPLKANWWDGIFAMNDRGVMFLNDLSTEILTGRGGFQKDVSELNFFPESTDVTRFWYNNQLYNDDLDCDGYLNDISMYTTVINQIEECGFLSDTKKERYIAEVRCARGLLAYTLYDMYGPLVIAPIEILLNPLTEQPLARLTREEMVQFIEDDLNYAAEHLDYPADTEYGKFSKGLAKVLLIRLYLHEAATDKAYYTQVESVAKELMNSQYGYLLEPSYPAMFEVNGQGKGNTEIIWALPCTSGGPNLNDWHGTVLPTDFGDFDMNPGYSTANSTWWFYDTFEANDTRKTYLLASYINNKGETVDRDHPGQTIDQGPIPMKLGPDPNVKSAGVSVIDIIVYRYAEAYLALAEALYMKPGATTTDKQNALTYINDIRQRAQLAPLAYTDIDTEEKFIDRLLLERSHEFWCENGQYRADLIRLGKFLEHAVEVTGTAYATSYKEVYPLPAAAIVDGKGVVIQNPQY